MNTLAEIVDFLKSEFDKIMLCVLFFLTMGFLLHAIHHTTDGATITWLEDIVGQILAALLTLLVGARMQNRKTDGSNGTTAPPAPPVTLPPANGD